MRCWKGCYRDACRARGGHASRMVFRVVRVLVARGGRVAYGIPGCTGSRGAGGARVAHAIPGCTGSRGAGGPASRMPFRVARVLVARFPRLKPWADSYVNGCAVNIIIQLFNIP